MHFHFRTRGVGSGFTGSPLNPIALRSEIARDLALLDPQGVGGRLHNYSRRTGVQFGHSVYLDSRNLVKPSLRPHAKTGQLTESLPLIDSIRKEQTWISQAFSFQRDLGSIPKRKPTLRTN